MGSIYLRKYAIATTVDFCLYKLDGTGLKTDAASASGDVTLYRDEAAVETLDADAFTDEGAIYSLALSQAEMTAARIIVCIVDQSGPQVWLDKVLIVETYGHASAMHAFDLSVATQPVNVTQIGGVVQSLTDFKDLVDTGYDPATHKVAGVVLVDTTTTNTDMISAATVNAQCDTALSDIDLDHLVKTTIGAGKPTVGTLFDKVMNKAAGQTFDPTTDSLEAIVDVDLTPILADTNELQTDWVNGGRLDLLIDLIKTDTADISPTLADTNELQTDWHNGGRLDLLIDGIKAVTDTLTLAAIADAVHDETVEGAYTFRELTRLVSAALAGKTSETVPGTLVIRDANDTADRITSTMDANRYRTAVVLNP